MKILKKYTSAILLLLLTTTMAPLNANLEESLINKKEELKKWCKQYISEEKIDFIETGLQIIVIVSVLAFAYKASSGWAEAQSRSFEKKFKKEDPKGYNDWLKVNRSSIGNIYQEILVL